MQREDANWSRPSRGALFHSPPVPLDLVEHYGKAEITKALGTADPKAARQRLPLEWAPWIAS
jgi:hypothetical protein